MSNFNSQISLKYSKLSEKNNPIFEEDYEKYGVKRGLRNPNGTGVLVGLTGIGNVVGYNLIDEKNIPCLGRLYYRGVEIKNIVDRIQEKKRFGFEETIYLLLFGEFPGESESLEFRDVINSFSSLPAGFKENIIFKNPSSDIINQLQKCILSLYAFDERSEDLSLPNLVSQSLSLISKVPILTVYNYHSKKHTHDDKSLYIHRVQEDLSIAENILYLLRSDHSYTDIEAETLDLMLVLHAEHGGGNNSTFSTHVLASSGTDTYSIIAAAMGSLKGPKHGGANITVYNMIKDLKKHCPDLTSRDQIKTYLKGIIQKKNFDQKGLIYGMGHAVYTLSDPRAELLKGKARELSIKMGLENQYNLYESIEDISKEIFSEVKGEDFIICANIDLYSSLIYDMLSIPTELFTPLFATARLSGWCAHRIEQILSDSKIIRPAYRSVVKLKKYKEEEALLASNI